MIRDIKDFSKKLCWSDAGDNTYDLLNGGGISGSFLLRTVLENLLKVPTPNISEKVINSFVLLA